MAPSFKIRSSQGCWTCRLRKKKCDERKPVCSTCGTLEITCIYGEKKPEWLDGGEREKNMADHLKAMVKVKASERREKKWLSSPEADRMDIASNRASSAENDKTLSNTMTSQMILDPSVDRDHTDTSSSAYTPATSVAEGSEAAEPHYVGIQPFEPASAEMNNSLNQRMLMTAYHTSHFPDPSSEREFTSSMMYLDFVFPYLFPFYRPTLLSGGRGWLLVLLMKNKALFHAVLSLASYFFSLVLSVTIDDHHDCKEHNWAELQKQQELAIKELQRNMSNLYSTGIQNSFEKSIEAVESIVQFLTFEVVIDSQENWQAHLTAATNLFEQIHSIFATDSEKPWYSVLARMGPENLEIQLPYGAHPWTSAQSSFRFLTVDLVLKDILASTALGKRPSLQRFHSELLDGDNAHLLSEDFNGCHNWVILLIGEIASLDAWKKEQKSAGTLSMMHLVKRASCIESRLHTGLVLLETVPLEGMVDPSARPPDQTSLGSISEPSIQLDKMRTTPSQAFHSRIWATAALTYLAVVVSGFQPALPEIQTTVAANMALFRMLPSPLCLRTLKWPFAVTGFLSLPGQEDFFRDIVSNMGMLQIFGTAGETLKVLNGVWEYRSQIEADSWDIASCLNILGHPSLLN
ncbi:fungal-specific transcription factor domain-containing protein [Xylariales sp. PMI_506]|nr:fungal-specific transcription factor domain-containing protein [Xylariales sp. PMI_506]